MICPIAPRKNPQTSLKLFIYFGIVLRVAYVLENTHCLYINMNRVFTLSYADNKKVSHANIVK